MVTLRPMTDADVPGAVHAFDSGFLAMRARYGLPVTASSLQNDRRRQNRTRHFLTTDPGGSWVAEDDGVIVGMSQSFVREGYWVLSQLGAVPGRQGRGLGRELLRLAHSHGDPQSPGTIQCSRDPKAMALYSNLGFSLHPVVAAWGPCDRGGATTGRGRPLRRGGGHRGPARSRDGHRPGRARLGPPGRHRDDAVRRGQPPPAARGSGVRGGQGRAHRHPRGPQRGVSRTRAARHAGRGSAGRDRRDQLADGGPAVGHPGPDQAGVELQPYGPVMVRGMPGPPSPYIPSGGYG